MPGPSFDNPWPSLRAVVSAVTAAMERGRFIEDVLDVVRSSIGARSAWSTLTDQATGPIQRSRTSNFYGVSPALLADHVTTVLGEVQRQDRPVAGAVPYSDEGSFVAAPLRASSHARRNEPSRFGAIYLDFPSSQGEQPQTVEFVECVASLLGAIAAQREQVEQVREDLRERDAKHEPHHYLGLDELLAPRSMRAIHDEVRAAIRGKGSIIILGESGTGKTQLATAIARASNRTPIVRATLGFSDDLNTITSELFGHERGAYSGAVSKRKGLVEHAHEGTLILDEILNLPPHAQQLLLDFTQFGSYRPLGYQGRDPKTADVRLIAVTNGDIHRAIADTRFRQDLYFRLATVPLVLPPLRARREDIPHIAAGYLRRTDPPKRWSFDPSALAVLLHPSLEWAGNIRELEAVAERARGRALASDDEAETIYAEHLDLCPNPIREGEEAPPGVRDTRHLPFKERLEQLSLDREKLDLVEREIIEEALASCRGVVAKTARVLSVSRTSLISRMATLQVGVRDEAESSR